MDPTRTRQLISLKESIRECRQCPLSNSSHPVPFSGWLDPTRPSYAIVGEAPGPKENDAGKPFIGPAGKFLRAELKVVERDEKCPTDNTVFLNTVNCWPRGTGGQAIREPTSREREACRPWLIQQLEMLAPDFVLVTGNSALNYWWKDRKITESRGKWWKSPTPLSAVLTDTLLFSTFHPSAVIREKNTNKLLLQFRHDLATFYEVGAMMWTARKFGVVQDGMEVTDAWLRESGGGSTGTGSRGRSRKRIPTDEQAPGLFAVEDR